MWRVEPPSPKAYGCCLDACQICRFDVSPSSRSLGMCALSRTYTPEKTLFCLFGQAASRRSAGESQCQNFPRHVLFSIVPKYWPRVVLLSPKSRVSNRESFATRDTRVTPRTGEPTKQSTHYCTVFNVPFTERNGRALTLRAMTCASFAAVTATILLCTQIIYRVTKPAIRRSAMCLQQVNCIVDVNLMRMLKRKLLNCGLETISWIEARKAAADDDKRPTKH